MRSFHNDDTASHLRERENPLPQRRRHGRVRVDQTQVDGLGRVIDISASGLRVARKRGPLYPVGECLRVRVRSLDRSVVLPARIVRAEKRPGLGSVHALTFLALDDAQRRALNRMVAGAWNMLTVAAE